MLIAPISSEQFDHVGRGYPRPQLQRPQWYSLNGPWEFAIDQKGEWRRAADVEWGAAIQVPFAPEAPASGIGDTGFFRVCWYRRRVELPPNHDQQRRFLHFGAVDYAATVWINGVFVGEHQGGYTPFSFDITDCTRDD